MKKILNYQEKRNEKTINSYKKICKKFINNDDDIFIEYFDDPKDIITINYDKKNNSLEMKRKGIISYQFTHRINTIEKMKINILNTTSENEYEILIETLTIEIIENSKNIELFLIYKIENDIIECKYSLEGN